MSFLDSLRIGVDRMRAVCGFNRDMDSRMRPRGFVEAVLRDQFGNIKQVERTHNLVTTNGDNYFAGLARVGGAVWATNAMKLGTATTAAAKSGAGSFIGTGDYISGSAKACDNASPKQGASANITQYLRTYAAGEGTSTTVNRVAIVDNTTDAGEADATHTAAIAVFPNTIAKGASDTLTVTWNITWLGA